MKQFQCFKCNKIFSTEGDKVEKNNPIYGKIWKWQAKHACGIICDEYYKPEIKSKKKKRSSCSGNCQKCPYKKL